MQHNKQTEPCHVPLADVLAHLNADAALSPEARSLAFDRIWQATRASDERLGLRAAGLPDRG
jgi:hypothetical protein